MGCEGLCKAHPHSLAGPAGRKVMGAMVTLQELAREEKNPQRRMLTWGWCSQNTPQHPPCGDQLQGSGTQRLLGMSDGSLSKGRGEGQGLWWPWAEQSLKHRLVFHNNSQLHNEKFAAVLNCRLLLNHFPSFCLRLDI